MSAGCSHFNEYKYEFFGIPCVIETSSSYDGARWYAEIYIDGECVGISAACATEWAALWDAYNELAVESDRRRRANF